MSNITKEGLAGLRLLICMAKADGVLKADERFELEDSLAGVSFPDGLTAEKLLNETNDIDALTREITSPEARDYTYASVFSLAYCDRELATAEENLLEKLRNAWGIQPE